MYINYMNMNAETPALRMVLKPSPARREHTREKSCALLEQIERVLFPRMT